MDAYIYVPHIYNDICDLGFDNCNFRDEDGNDWEYHNGQFHKRNY